MRRSRLLHSITHAHPRHLVGEKGYAHRAGARRFVKYNGNLRGSEPVLEACKGNAYVTTTHVINSCIVKASKLTRVARVYRGVAGGVLPERFWTPNAQGVRGGVEMAFLSTTYDRDVAMRAVRAPVVEAEERGCRALARGDGVEPFEAAQRRVRVRAGAVVLLNVLGHLRGEARAAFLERP